MENITDQFAVDPFDYQDLDLVFQKIILPGETKALFELVHVFSNHLG